VENELKFFVSQLQVESGIAKNRALSENCLALFACLITRTPVIICGKPGCSKTLSMSIIRTSMQGNNSESEFLRCFPLVTCIFYQGSETSTSEGVIEAFQKAQERHDGYKSANGESKFRVVLVFDEIGVAELSPHNPLKVLHKYLDDKEYPAAFVGISNWRLDDSKSNRAILIGRPDLDYVDALLTSQEIFEETGVRVDHTTVGVKIDQCFQFLSKTYAEFIEKQEKEFRNISDFPSPPSLA